MLKRCRQEGFSLIELFTAVAIFGILIALGIPAIGTYAQTARLGTLAKSFYTGVQLARTQAIQLNQRVDFVQTTTPLTAPATAAPDPNGTSWVVRYTPAGLPVVVVEARNALEGGGSGPAITATGSAATLTFNGLGAMTNAAAAQIDIANPLVGACNPAGPVMCMRVAVSPGGQVRLCNPNLGAAAALDTRGCN